MTLVNEDMDKMWEYLSKNDQEFNLGEYNKMDSLPHNMVRSTQIQLLLKSSLHLITYLIL